MSVNSLAVMSGIDPGNLRKMLAEKQTITDKTLKKISAATGMNFDWLLTGEGEMMKAERGDDCSPFIIPLIPAVAMAGPLPDVADPVFRSQCRRVQAPVAGCDFAIQISGDSMLPDFKSGDFLAVSRITDPRMLPYSVPLLIDTREGALLKCLEPCDRDNLTAVSLNPAYRPYTVPKDIILAVYRVRAVFRIINTL